MIRDIENAFFAQLAYLNWNNLNIDDIENEYPYMYKEFQNFLKLEKIWDKIKINNSEPELKNGIMTYDEEDKRLFGTFGIIRNKQKPEHLDPLYNFDGWQFIYSADETKLYKDKFDLDVEDHGFFACAFKKDNDIVIAYRGTEITAKDFYTDYKIAYADLNDTQLTCTYLFIRHIEELYEGCNINITGHSLGGCLAQYAYISTEKKYNTVTWNGLGVGKFRNKLKKNEYNISEDICNYLDPLRYHLKNFDSNPLKNKEHLVVKIENHFIKNEKIILTNKDDDFLKIKELISKNIVDPHLFDKNLIPNFDKFIETQIAVATTQIYWLLENVYQIDLHKDKESSNIINFYNVLDWTPDLQTREGVCMDVLTGQEFVEETDDSKSRIINSTIAKFGFSYHGVNDFLLYMTPSGMIQGGKYNDIFIKNTIKTIYKKILKDDNSRVDGYKKFEFIKNGKTKEDNPFKLFHQTCKRPIRRKDITNELELSKIKYIRPFQNTLKNSITPYVPYIAHSKDEIPKDSNELGYFRIGELSNVSLAGIESGNPVTLIKIGEPKKNEVKTKEEVAEEKRQAKLNELYGGNTIGWGSTAGGIQYEVIRNHSGQVVRRPLYSK